MQKRLDTAETKIKLLINPREEDHVKLTDLIRSAVAEILNIAKDRQDSKLVDLQNSIISLSQEILKREWNRVKMVE